MDAAADHGAQPDTVSDTERAVFGSVEAVELAGFLDRWAGRQLGSSIEFVRFRAGRIDAVWGVELADGRAVVIKAHRPPVDIEATRNAVEAQRVLAAAGFPCAIPLAGPDLADGHVLTAETLVHGHMPDGRDPLVRRLLAEGLAEQIEILRRFPDLLDRAGPGQSWCQYQAGPWPAPHDTLVNFEETPSGYEWLDEFGQRAADQILNNRDPASVVVGHADWYAGNTVVADGVLVGSFDWELVVDTEAVIAGFAAACFASSATGGGGLSTPEEVAAFLHDYTDARAVPLSDSEWLTAIAAAAWIVAFNARWQVALFELGMGDEATVTLVRDRGDQYLTLS